MVYFQYAVWTIAGLFILAWTFLLVVTPSRISIPNRCTLFSWWACAGGAALGLYSVFHLLWLMPLAVVLGSLGIIGIGVIGTAIAILTFFFHRTI